MVKKRSGKPRSLESPDVDDLKLIKGIGPAVEKRLKGAGIHTFARLAALLPADIVAAINDIAGMTTEHVIREDWIGQARKLAASGSVTEPQKDAETLMTSEQHPIMDSIQPSGAAEAAKGRQHSAVFAVELVLSEDNDVLRTEILHVESKHKETWHDWQEAQLVGFIAQYANLKLQPVQPLDLTMKQSSAPPAAAAIAAHEAAQVEPSAQAVEETAPAPTQVESALPVAEQITTATQVSSSGGLTGLLRIIELQTLLTDIHIPHNVLRAGQPFEICLTLDLTDIVASPDSELAYTASFYGQSLGGSTRHTVGITHGTTRPGDRITVRIGGRSLPRGIYWLEALVSVKLATGRDSPRQELITYKRGDPLEVY